MQPSTPSSAARRVISIEVRVTLVPVPATTNAFPFASSTTMRQTRSRS